MPPYFVVGPPPGNYFDPAIYGPPGTFWVWTSDEETAARTALGQEHAADVVAAILKWIQKLKIYFPGDAYVWRTPFGALYPPGHVNEGPPMRYLATTIHGKLGTVEEVAHTLKWRTPTLNADLTAAQVVTFNNTVRDKWQDFLESVVTGTTKVRGLLDNSLTYDVCKTAYIDQATPAQVRPPYLVPTQYAAFSNAGGISSGTGSGLPWEVAMCISLNSNYRGPRFRGRLYLGPIGNTLMDAGGMLNPTLANGIGTKFWTSFVVPVSSTSGMELHVVSRKWNTSAVITGARVGHVPDSQRRRRRSQAEAYTQVGGAAMGTL